VLNQAIPVEFCVTQGIVKRPLSRVVATSYVCSARIAPGSRTIRKLKRLDKALGPEVGFWEMRFLEPSPGAAGRLPCLFPWMAFPGSRLLDGRAVLNSQSLPPVKNLAKAIFRSILTC
jgi:hypothetical protein